MMESNSKLVLGYDLECWNNLGIKEPIVVDISRKANSHILINGLSGSGKSTLELQLLTKLILAEQNGEYYFADYKGDDMFEFLKGTPRYRTFKHTTELLDIVYNRLYDRMNGKDKTRHPITLIWDEYMANILAIMNEDKKEATKIINKVSEILIMGRSMAVRFLSSSPRSDMAVYTAGSRLNYGIVIILSSTRSIYEMLMPDHLEKIRGKEFNIGEGAVLLQGAKFRYIKIGKANFERMKSICFEALSRPIDGGEA